EPLSAYGSASADAFQPVRDVATDSDGDATADGGWGRPKV
ncbi:MAG: hypothetical protein RLZZ01_847, partial [Actinomycetota bacterium]